MWTNGSCNPAACPSSSEQPFLPASRHTGADRVGHVNRPDGASLGAAVSIRFAAILESFNLKLVVNRSSVSIMAVSNNKNTLRKRERFFGGTSARSVQKFREPVVGNEPGSPDLRRAHCCGAVGLLSSLLASLVSYCEQSSLKTLLCQSFNTTAPRFEATECWTFSSDWMGCGAFGTGWHQAANPQTSFSTSPEILPLPPLDICKTFRYVRELADRPFPPFLRITWLAGALDQLFFGFWSCRPIVACSIGRSNAFAVCISCHCHSIRACLAKLRMSGSTGIITELCCWCVILLTVIIRLALCMATVLQIRARCHCTNSHTHQRYKRSS